MVQALEAQNLAAPVGRVQGQFDERAIRLRGRLEGPADFAQLVVAERNGTLIRLGQVADVRDGTEEQRTLALYNGTEAVGIDIKKSKGYSTTDVSAELLARVQKLEKTLPAGTTINVVKNSGVRVSRGRAQRAGDAGRGRVAHGARRVPLPQLVALDGDHRPGAAGLACSRRSSRSGRSASR